MNYSQDEFFELMNAVDKQGGEHLDEQCTSTTYVFGKGKKKAKLTFPMCGNPSLFEVPYLQDEDADTLVPEAELPRIKVCAVDDAMGAWPRFGGNYAPEDNDPYSKFFDPPEEEA